MKKNKLVNTLGIEINEGVFYEQPAGEAKSQQNIFDYIMKLLLIFLGCVGMMHCLENSYSILFDNVFVMVALAPISLYLLILFSCGRKCRRWMTAAGVLLTLILVYLNWASLVASVCYTYSIIAGSYNSYYGAALYLFEIETVDVNAGNLAMLVFLLPVCMLLAYSAGHSSRIRYAVAAFLPYMVMVMASGHMPDAFPMYLVLGSFLGLMVISKTAFCGEFQPHIHTDYASQKGLRGFAVLFMTFFIAASAYLGYGLFYTRVENVLGPIRYAVYNSSFRELYDQLRGGYSAGGINGGKINGGGKLKFNHSVHLIIETDTDINQYTYLKGYVGEVYDGMGWNALPASAYNSETFSALDGYDEADIMSMSYKLSQNLKDMRIDSKTIFSELSTARWFVRVPDVYVGDSNYLCYPYASLVSDEDGDIVNLTYLTRASSGELENVYDMYYFQTGNSWTGSVLDSMQSDMDLLEAYESDLLLAASSDLVKYLELEKTYRSFVYENDLEVPERVSRLRDEYAGLSFDTLAEAVEFVQEEVAKDAAYTLEPGRCPYGKDFIEYFMYEQKEGYCIYFASAAVMIFRCLGIPARFVQGYIIPPVDANTELSIDDSYAHAWPEIYVDGFGWLPVEVTPGIGGVAGGFTPDMNQEEQSASGPENTSKPEPSMEITMEQTAEQASKQTAEAPPSAERSTAETAETEERTLAQGTTKGNMEHTTASGTIAATGSNGGGHGSGSGAGPGSPDGDVESSGMTISAAAVRVIRNIFLVLALLMLVSGFMYSHRRSRIAARHRRFNQRSSRNCCLAIYRELCRMSTRYYMPMDDASDPHELSLYYPIEEETWNEVQCIARETAFSTHEITGEKKQLMLSVYHKCCRHIDTKLRFTKKLVFHLWDGYR